MLIGISGKKGSGKTTLATALAAHFGARVVGFADPIKRLCEDLFPDAPFSAWWGTNDEKSVLHTALSRLSGRWVMQQVGNVMRQFDPQCWVNLAIREQPDRAVYADVRYPNEVRAIQAAGGIVVRLTRDPLPPDRHESETALDGFVGYDCVVPAGFDAARTLSHVCDYLQVTRT